MPSELFYHARLQSFVSADMVDSEGASKSESRQELQASQER